MVVSICFYLESYASFVSREAHLVFYRFTKYARAPLSGSRAPLFFYQSPPVWPGGHQYAVLVQSSSDWTGNIPEQPALELRHKRMFIDNKLYLSYKI